MRVSVCRRRHSKGCARRRGLSRVKMVTAMIAHPFQDRALHRSAGDRAPKRVRKRTDLLRQYIINFRTR